jgi:hypothetical protein
MYHQSAEYSLSERISGRYTFKLGAKSATLVSLVNQRLTA